jgi:hypothetical protein
LLARSPGLKKRNSKWVGLVPDMGRGKAFAVIFVLCALQILAKAVATALLVITDGAWLLYYMIGDHAAHFAYRAVRRDFLYYVSSLRARFSSIRQRRST